MSTLSDAIEANDYLNKVLATGHTYQANEALREIMSKPEYGLGVAILVAWQHGLRVGHIRSKLSEVYDPQDSGVRVIGPEQDCPYIFVHVPVRQYRRRTDMLVEHELFNPNADPAALVYHEDGLIGTFSFMNPESVDLAADDIAEILRALAQQGILVPANSENRQIQFKDLDVKRRIEASGEQVYVRVDHHELNRLNVRLPAGYDSEDVWEYVLKSLKYKFACNYCSVQALSPTEVTINSAHARTQSQQVDEQATVRNYQLGFTFAPVGEPGDVCHFLAWDFPHISDLVMNMEPQPYSFSDLIRLVREINRKIASFCGRYGVRPIPEISGACNHWAGNSIYHQHYQFVRIAQLPLLMASEQSKQFLTYNDAVEVRHFPAWPAAAYMIRPLPGGGDEDVIKVADSLAREWRLLNDSEDRPYGNEILIKNYSQNIFATIDKGRLTAIFIPRLRSRVTTKREDNAIQKSNAGILEMMGYFVIDDPDDIKVIERMPALERKELGDSWLSELGAPATAAQEFNAIQEFENNVKVCLSSAVDPYEQRIGELLLNRFGDWRAKARDLMLSFQHDPQLNPDHPLNPDQREHLYRELAWAILEASESEVGQQAPE